MKSTEFASLLLRCALGIGFLSAVASRLGFWGKHSSGWSSFMKYAEQVNSFAPRPLIPTLAITATALEAIFGIMLLIGFKTTSAALGSALLSLIFAVAMAYSFGLKEPLDYSVFVFSAGAFLLATLSADKWSVDQLISLWI